MGTGKMTQLAKGLAALLVLSLIPGVEKEPIPTSPPLISTGELSHALTTPTHKK